MNSCPIYGILSDNAGIALTEAKYAGAIGENANNFFGNIAAGDRMYDGQFKVIEAAAAHAVTEAVDGR